MSEISRLGDVVPEVLTSIEQRRAEHKRKVIAATMDFLSSKCPNRKRHREPARQKQKALF
jgi:NAD-dependent DNA ligase